MSTTAGIDRNANSPERLRRAMQRTSDKLDSVVNTLFVGFEGMTITGSTVEFSFDLEYKCPSAQLEPESLIYIDGDFNVDAAGNALTIRLQLAGVDIATVVNALSLSTADAMSVRCRMYIESATTALIYSEAVHSAGIIAVTRTLATVTLTGNPTIGFSGQWQSNNGDAVTQDLMVVRK